jgi:hypothetical protein
MDQERNNSATHSVCVRMPIRGSSLIFSFGCVFSSSKVFFVWVRAFVPEMSIVQFYGQPCAFFLP